jgi:hypothetical protein
MARFLTDTDYNSIIQSADLAQITEGVAQNLIDAELKSIAKMRTKLVQRYDMDAELAKTGTDRYPLLIEIAMDLTLYNIYARINPRNIPTLRVERNREALDQLDAWASGTDTAEMTEIDVANQQGLSIRYGSSDTKQNNFFI